MKLWVLFIAKNPVFIWFQSFVFETSWLSSSCYNNKKNYKMCEHVSMIFQTQKHIRVAVVINFNQFHSPLESCHERKFVSIFVSTHGKDQIVFRMFNYDLSTMQKILEHGALMYGGTLNAIKNCLKIQCNLKELSPPRQINYITKGHKK